MHVGLLNYASIYTYIIHMQCYTRIFFIEILYIGGFVGALAVWHFRLLGF